MKQWLVTAVIGLCFFSCKKEMLSSVGQSVISDDYFKKVKSELKDSLSGNDFGTIDESQWYKSKEAQSDNYFVRIAFLGKEFTTDFILLKTDSIGNIREGKIIHVSKTNDVSIASDLMFCGQFTISSLSRAISLTKEVVNGRWKKKSNLSSMMEQDDWDDEDMLPEVVVTSYSYDGVYTGDWYWYGSFYDDGYSSGGGGDYTYGSSGGGGSTGTTANTNHEDKTMNIEVEPNDESPIKVEDYTKCFSTVPDANATYQITLYADIPVNGDPSELFNTSTGEVGHTFIQLRKASGGTSIQQNIGFYPQTGWKSLSSFYVDSKVVDNAGHEFNSSLTATLNSTEFQAALNEVQAIAGKDYNIETWNCTDFGLAVFNAANTGEALTIPKYIIPGTNTYSSTPQALYATMEGMKNGGNDSYGEIDIPGIAGYVGDSHGSCGN